ncbi:MAG: transposase [Candidatus Omnitrophica bacterium]|nr:transposase [Candidatus Omnitrophota bacterium]
MPRTARLLLNNVCYHVITRGNQSKKVFLDNKDFNVYLRLLRKYKLKYKFKIYAYCLMKNHVHIIIDPKDHNDLSKIMQGLNQSYAIYFNHRYHKNGHLWQERYKSMIIAKDAYFANCLNYIEANPMRAGIAKTLQWYNWSSYKYRISGRRNRLLDFIDVL